MSKAVILMLAATIGAVTAWLVVSAWQQGWRLVLVLVLGLGLGIGIGLAWAARIGFQMGVVMVVVLFLGLILGVVVGLVLGLLLRAGSFSPLVRPGK